jgi:hypothetical protein
MGGLALLRCVGPDSFVSLAGDALLEMVTTAALPVVPQVSAIGVDSCAMSRSESIKHAPADNPNDMRSAPKEAR